MKLRGMRSKMSLKERLNYSPVRDGYFINEKGDVIKDIKEVDGTNTFTYETVWHNGHHVTIIYVPEIVEKLIKEFAWKRRHSGTNQTGLRKACTKASLRYNENRKL